MTEIQDSSEPIKTDVKSPVEKVKSGIEKVRENTRRAFVVTGMAKKSKIPREKGEQLEKKLADTRDELAEISQSGEGAHGEIIDRERTLDERFERGEMFRIIKRIREKKSVANTVEEKEKWSQRLNSTKEIFNDLANNLDTLNRQYYSPEHMQLVGVDVLGEEVGIPVRRYTLRDSNVNQSEESESPVVIIGGATSGSTVTKSTAEAFALQYPNRDVYVIGYPGSSMTEITPDLPEKVKKDGNLGTFSKLNKDVINKMGIENFDLVGISMGGGIALDAATDSEFAEKINNLVAISPTNVQETQGMIKLGASFGYELLGKAGLKRKEWVRVPQTQPGYPIKPLKGMGFGMYAEIIRHKAISKDDLAKIQVGGRVIIGTGENDTVISCPQIRAETAEANKIRTEKGSRKIEFMGVEGGHHTMGDVYASGIVSLIRNTENLPSQISAKELPKTTAEVFVRENAQLTPVAGEILK